MDIRQFMKRKKFLIDEA